MSKENVLHHFELRVVIKEGDGSSASWYIETDDPIRDTLNVSIEEFTEQGAPLSAMGSGRCTICWVGKSSISPFAVQTTFGTDAFTN